MHLGAGTREHFLAALARDWPEELERYERLFEGRAYLASEHVDPVRDRVRALAASRAAARRPVLRPPPEPEQLQLAV